MSRASLLVWKHRSYAYEEKKSKAAWEKREKEEYKFLKRMISNYKRKLSGDARRSKIYNQWRIKVFNRDNYTCQVCGLRGKGIQAHHIKSWKNYPEERLDVSNGVTLCKECHKDTHNYKGRGRMTRKQEETFFRMQGYAQEYMQGDK